MKTIEVGRQEGTFFIEFDQDEIALRIVESVGGLARAPGMSARDAMAEMAQRAPRTAEQTLAAAKAIMEYIEQQFQNPGELQ
jgi:hypothetical protein